MPSVKISNWPPVAEVHIRQHHSGTFVRENRLQFVKVQAGPILDPNLPGFGMKRARTVFFVSLRFPCSPPQRRRPQVSLLTIPTIETPPNSRPWRGELRRKIGERAEYLYALPRLFSIAIMDSRGRKYQHQLPTEACPSKISEPHPFPHKTAIASHCISTLR